MKKFCEKPQIRLQKCVECSDIFNYPIKIDICPNCQMDLADQNEDEDED